MTNEDKLYEVDTFVAMCEDFMHGKDGDDATRCRRLLADVIKDLSKLHQSTVIGSYAIVRWYDNNNEDVVCTTKEVAEDYVKKYNALSGKEKCFVDTEIWLPLKEA